MWRRLKEAGERVIAALHRWADRIESHVDEMDAEPISTPAHRLAATLDEVAGNGKKRTTKA